MSKPEMFTDSQVRILETLARGLGAKDERDRINGIIDQFIENSDYPEVASSLEWLQDVINGENNV